MADINELTEQEISDATTLNKIAADFLKRKQDEAISPDRTNTSGFVNPVSGSSLLQDKDGNVSSVSNTQNKALMNSESSTQVDVCLEKVLITNRERHITDDIIINNHKLNPQIYELGDIVQSNGIMQGNLNMFGTVLIKTWEPHLKKYVLVRRLIKTPIFSQTLNLPVINELFDLDNI